MMKNIIKSLILAVAFLAVSCESFLDEQPVHSLVIENAVTDFNAAKNILNGIYTTFQNSAWGGDVSSPLSSQAGFYVGSAQHYQMSYNQSNETTSGVWKAYYTTVNASNAAIETLGNLSVENYPSEEVKNEMIAEAKCLRAWAYANIFWLYGHWWAQPEDKYGLLFRTEMANLTNIQVGRLSVGESYEVILADLDIAINSLKSYTASKFLSKEAAQMIKAKLLLRRAWDGDYNEALALVQDIRLNAPSGFQMEADMAAMYTAGFDSKEVLWARYLDNYPKTNNRVDKNYSYYLVTSNNYRSYANEWLIADPRYDVIMGETRAPASWDKKFYFGLRKLCHGGYVADPQANYTAYYLRYAELLLMESELIIRTGGTVADALVPLNEMRTVRTNPVLPALTASSEDEFMDMLFKELCLEQFLENGNEYYASLRFMKDGQPWLNTLKPDVDFSSDQLCWPIPDVEIQNNRKMFQNSGLN